jgi:adenylate cyclase
MGPSASNRKKAQGKAAWTAFLLIGAASALVVLFAWWLRPGFLVAMDLKAADAMFMARGQRPAPSGVVIVAVDEKSVNELGRWPWTRKTTAALITALSEAKTVAVDMVFSEPQDAASDAALAGAVASRSNVVLGYFFRGDTSAVPEPSAMSSLEKSRISLLIDDAGTRPWPAFPSVETNTPMIGAGAAGFGAFNTMPAEDGIYREMGLVFGYGPGVYPSLPLEALSSHLGGDVVVRLAEYGVDGLFLGPLEVPVDESGALMLNYYGPSGSFKTWPAADVIKGRVPAGEFAGKLVFVGVTEKAVYDIRPTPLDSLFPGVELHATAAANVLESDFIIRDGRVIAFDALITLLAPLFLGLALSKVRRTVAGLAGFIVLSVSVVAGEFILFSVFNIMPAVVYPVLSIAVCYISGEAYRNLVAEKRSRYLKRAFSSYVSPELVSEILDDPGALKLGGEKRVVSVLFSDIRGFTGISERFSPEELVEFLNRYLSPMTGIVLEEKGMVDKYIGDAIMAVFNAPVEVEGHAGRACTAALRMTGALASFNARWEGSGYPTIEIGIGVNTGEAVVGNMGAELKLNYTAIGDTVNLASRLEGMNKVYGTSILVSGATKEAAAEAFLFREVDFVRVAGKERPIAVYELAGRKGADPAKEEACARFEAALALFRARRFEEAGSAFATLSALGDRPSAVYLERCVEFAKTPPPAGWDGAYEAASK